MARIMMDVPDRELWSAVFGSAFETYPWWVSEDFLDGDWDNPCQVTLSIEDPNEPEGSDRQVSKTFGIYELVEAVNTCIRTGVIDSNWDNWDANDGDCIAQVAVLGDVVYG
jgi:hypothetical protein